MPTENEQTPTPQGTPATGTPPATGSATEPTSGTLQSPAQSQPETSGSTDLGATPTPEAPATDLGAEEETPEAPKPPEFFGAPEGDATYEAFTLPEGSVANPELQESFTSVAKELGLNQAGAQKLVDYKMKLDQAQIKAWGDHLVELKTIARADPEIGGSKYDPAVAASRQVIAKFGTPALRKVMDAYGVGAHPEMIRFMAKIAHVTGETPTRGVREGSGTAAEKPLHELFYGDSSRSNQGT